MRERRDPASPKITPRSIHPPRFHHPPQYTTVPTMKRLSRIYDPIAGLGVERAAAQRQSRFICQRCRLRSTTYRPSTLASQFSTSSRLCAEVAVEDQNSKEVATTESDDGLASGKYKLATTWDGLEWVGTPAWYEKTKRPVGTFRAWVKVNGH